MGCISPESPPHRIPLHQYYHYSDSILFMKYIHTTGHVLKSKPLSSLYMRVRHEVLLTQCSVVLSRHVAHGRNDVGVNINALEEYSLRDEFIVVVQEDGSVVHR